MGGHPIHRPDRTGPHTGTRLFEKKKKKENGQRIGVRLFSPLFFSLFEF